jgi:hypothetical protein
MQENQYNQLVNFWKNKRGDADSAISCYPLEWGKKTHDGDRRSLRRASKSFRLKPEADTLQKIITNKVIMFCFVNPQFQ